VTAVAFHYSAANLDQSKGKFTRAYKDKESFSDPKNCLFTYECVDVLTTSQSYIKSHRILLSMSHLRSSDVSNEYFLLQVLVKLDCNKGVKVLIYNISDGEFSILKGSSVLKFFYCDPDLSLTEV
jgi:hypothetical protein